jgi:hypothetical protein
MRNSDQYISSDELRVLTKFGGAWYQIQQLKLLHIAFSLDAYGSPLVKRSDFENYRRLCVCNSSFHDGLPQ